MTMLILLGPAIEDAAVGKDVYSASATRVALFVGVALYAWATVWVLERWRASRSKALVLKRSCSILSPGDGRTSRGAASTTSIATTTAIRATIPWKGPPKRKPSLNAKASASRITNLDPNSTSQAVKKRMNFAKPPCLALKKAATPMLQGDREFQEDLQQHGGEQGDRERVGGNVLRPVFDEQVQHHEIHEGCGQVAHEPPLPGRGRVLQGVPQRGVSRCRHPLSPRLGAPQLDHGTTQGRHQREEEYQQPEFRSPSGDTDVRLTAN